METWEIKPTEDIRSKDGTTHPAPRSNSDFKEVKKPICKKTRKLVAKGTGGSGTGNRDQSEVE